MLLILSFVVRVLPAACLTVSEAAGGMVLGFLSSRTWRLPFVTQVGFFWVAELFLNLLYIHSNSWALGSSLANCLATNSLQGTAWYCFSFKKATQILGPNYLWNQSPPHITPFQLQTFSVNMHAGCSYCQSPGFRKTLQFPANKNLLFLSPSTGCKDYLYSQTQWRQVLNSESSPAPTAWASTHAVLLIFMLIPQRQQSTFEQRRPQTSVHVITVSNRLLCGLLAHWAWKETYYFIQHTVLSYEAPSIARLSCKESYSPGWGKTQKALIPC